MYCIVLILLLCAAYICSIISVGCLLFIAMPSPDWTRGPKGWEEAANLCRSRTREKSPPQRKTERIRVSTERKLPDTALEVITTRGATPNRVAKPKARETVGKKTVWWPKLWLPDGKAGRKGGPKGGHKGGKKGGPARRAPPLVR